MFIITNRAVDESRKDLKAFGSTLNPKGANELRVAEAVHAGNGWRVTILPDEITPQMAKEVGLTPETDLSTGKPKPVFASRYVARKLQERVNPEAAGIKGKKGKNLVFFVHGFNNDVKAVLDRAWKLEADYGVEVVAFSWPANGGGVHGVASYKSDKRDALASTGALDRCFGLIDRYLRELHDEHVGRIEREANRRFPDDAEKWDRFFSGQAAKWCPFSVNMALHSMGNYLFKHLLKSSTYRGDLLLFDNVLLIAADTNNEDHPSWLDRIQARSRVFVTINEKDSALGASRMKMGEAQKARLGHYPYRLLAKRAVYVDFTGAAHVGDSHAYFEKGPLRNTKVKKFFQDALNGRTAEAALPYDASTNTHRVK